MRGGRARFLQFAALAAGCLFLASHRAGMGGSAEASPTAYLTGTWTGTWLVTDRGVTNEYPLTLDFDSGVATSPANRDPGYIQPPTSNTVVINWITAGLETVQYALQGSTLTGSGSLRAYSDGRILLTRWNLHSASDTTAPGISASGIPGELWPPNHQMVRIKPMLVVADDRDPSPTATVSVTSSEPDNSLGDGDTAGDIVIHSPTDIELRAERSGTGTGRTYTLTWTATDASGNSSTFTATVTVPKSQGKSK